MCTCQSCGKKYKVDLLVSDKLWNLIKPEGKPDGAGLLCSHCIMEKLESRDQYDSYYLVPTDHVTVSY